MNPAVRVNIFNYIAMVLASSNSSFNATELKQQIYAFVLNISNNDPEILL